MPSALKHTLRHAVLAISALLALFVVAQRDRARGPPRHPHRHHRVRRRDQGVRRRRGQGGRPWRSCGYSLVCCGLDEDGGEAVLSGAGNAGARAMFRAFDLRDLAAARQFANDAMGPGGLTAIVNGAGARLRHGVAGARIEDIHACFALNFYPAWALSQETRPSLAASGRGIVVNITSVHAGATTPLRSPYKVSKAALGALTTSISVEWASDDIRGVSIAPALVHTRLMEAYYAPIDDPTAERERLEAQHPVGHAGCRQDIASLVTYLIGPANPFINGTIITVDGGIGARLG